MLTSQRIALCWRRLFSCRISSKTKELTAHFTHEFRLPVMFVWSSGVQWDSLILKILRELQADAPLQGALSENQEVNWAPWLGNPLAFGAVAFRIFYDKPEVRTSSATTDVCTLVMAEDWMLSAVLPLEKSYRYLSLNLFSMVPCLCQYWPFFCILVYGVIIFHARRSLALVFIVWGKQARCREWGTVHRQWSHFYHVYIL